MSQDGHRVESPSPKGGRVLVANRPNDMRALRAIGSLLPQAWPKDGRRAGLVAVALLFGGGLWSPPLLYLSMVFALLGFLPSPRFALASLSREPLAWLVALLAVWVALRGSLDLAFPVSPGIEADPRAIWHHVRYSGLVPLIFGFWLCAWWHRRLHLLAVFCLGLLVYFAESGHEILERVPFNGMRSGSVPELGFIAATGVVLTAGVALRTWYPRRRLRKGLRFALQVLAAGTAVISAGVLILSQARASWLSFAVALLVVAAITLYWWRANNPDESRRAIARPFMIITASVLLTLSISSGYIWERISHGEDLATVEALIAGEFGPHNEGSFARRYRIWQQGIEDLGEYPLWGIGPASVRGTLGDIAQPDAGEGNYHNTYLNLAVAMGVPWALLWVIVHLVAIVRAQHFLRMQERDPILAYMLVAAAIVHFGALAFEVRIWSVAGSAAYVILMTCVFAAVLRAQAGSAMEGVRDTGTGPHAAAGREI